MGCYEDIFQFAKSMVKKNNKNEFTIAEVTQYMMKEKSQYSSNTIRGVIGSSCCVDNPKHRHKYFKKVDRGIYKIFQD
jgi:hypothetical protein